MFALNRMMFLQKYVRSENYDGFLWIYFSQLIGVSGECHSWRSDILWARQTQDGDGMDVVYALKRQGRTLYGFGG